MSALPNSVVYYACRVALWLQGVEQEPFETMVLKCSECRQIADMFRMLGMAAWMECYAAIRL